MAISTESKRQSAFLDFWPVLIPDGEIGAADRPPLIGQYEFIIVPAATLPAIVIKVTLPTASMIFDIPSLWYESEQELSGPENVWVVRGDTPAWSLTFRQAGAPFSLQGWTVGVAATNDGTLFSRSATTTSVSDGTASFTWGSVDGLTSGTYDCTVSLTSVTETIALPPFKLFVVKDVS